MNQCNYIIRNLLILLCSSTICAISIDLKNVSTTELTHDNSVESAKIAPKLLISSVDLKSTHFNITEEIDFTNDNSSTEWTRVHSTKFADLDSDFVNTTSTSISIDTETTTAVLNSTDELTKIDSRLINDTSALPDIVAETATGAGINNKTVELTGISSELIYVSLKMIDIGTKRIDNITNNTRQLTNSDDLEEVLSIVIDIGTDTSNINDKNSSNIVITELTHTVSANESNATTSGIAALKPTTSGSIDKKGSDQVQQQNGESITWLADGEDNVKIVAEVLPDIVEYINDTISMNSTADTPLIDDYSDKDDANVDSNVNTDNILMLNHNNYDNRREQVWLEGQYSNNTKKIERKQEDINSTGHKNHDNNKSAIAKVQSIAKEEKMKQNFISTQVSINKTETTTGMKPVDTMENDEPESQIMIYTDGYFLSLVVLLLMFFILSSVIVYRIFSNRIM